jgi:hypothetical protein
MKIVLRRGVLWLAAAALALLSGCVASGGYAGAYDGQYYYQPGGYVYSGWGPGYQVGPPRGDDHHDHVRPAHVENQSAHPAYRSAPASRPVPSIPNQSHPQSHPH